MSYTYPAPAPTLSGDVTTASRFLNSPTVLSRRVNEIANARFVSDVLLSGRTDVAGGAIQYETVGDEKTSREPESVSAGAEYPLATVGGREAQIAKVSKDGLDTLVTDESIKRSRMNAVEQALQGLVNANVKQFDSASLSLIASAVTATQAAGAEWDGGTAEILRDILLAKAKIDGAGQGYSADTLVVNDLVYAYLASDPTIAGAMAREDTGNPVYTGNFGVIAGLRVLPTSNGPSSNPLVVDSKNLGGIGVEDLGGGYQRVGGVVETKSMREDREDQWRLRARRVAVPYVTDPGAGVFITGHGIS